MTFAMRWPKNYFFFFFYLLHKVWANTCTAHACTLIVHSPMALYRGSPVSLSHTNVVSLWLVTPTAERKQEASERNPLSISAAFSRSTGDFCSHGNHPLKTAHVFGTFNVGDVDVELAELLARPLDALVHRLDDLLGVLLHPSDGDQNDVNERWCGGNWDFKFRQGQFGATQIKARVSVLFRGSEAATARVVVRD